MPAEWSAHSATWLAWPYDDKRWLGYLESVRREFKALVEAISADETVHLLVNDDECENDIAERVLRGDIHLHRVANNDVWVRDSGPIFVQRQSNMGLEVALTNWEFNGWGMKFPSEHDNHVPQHVGQILGAPTLDINIVMEGGSLEVDGEGTCITTRQCLHSPMRNPGLAEQDLEKALQDSLGVRKVIWLEDGLEGDHTDGHVDTITRFVAPGVVVTCVSEDVADPNYAPMQRNLEILHNASDAKGRPLRVVPLPLPRYRYELKGSIAESEGVAGERLAASYANFFITNHSVIVPIYRDPNDQKALEILRGLFPSRQVMGLSARALVGGGGAFHCVTQQQPTGKIWRNE